MHIIIILTIGYQHLTPNSPYFYTNETMTAIKQRPLISLLLSRIEIKNKSNTWGFLKLKQWDQRCSIARLKLDKLNVQCEVFTKTIFFT